MFEDIAGQQSAGTRRTYSTCEECGQVFMRADAKTELTGLSDSGHSEWTELCPECEKLGRQGETPVMHGEPMV